MNVNPLNSVIKLISLLLIVDAVSLSYISGLNECKISTL